MLLTLENHREDSDNELATLLKKESLTQVVACEFCEIFKNTLFTEHLLTMMMMMNRFCGMVDRQKAI